jgi:hypothetical protein
VNKIKHKLLWFSILSFYVVILTITILMPNPTYNYRGPIQGRVLDQDTNLPVEGAVVHVDWFIIPIYGVGHSYFDSKEALTDKDGNFHISANWSFLPWRNFNMGSEGIIFKNEYGFVENVSGRVYQLREDEKFLQTLTDEKRKSMGPGYYFKMKLEGDFPIYLLKKLASDSDRGRNYPSLGPLRKSNKYLLMLEINKQDKTLGVNFKK